MTEDALTRVVGMDRLMGLADLDVARLLVRVAEPAQDRLRMRLHLHRREDPGWRHAAALSGSVGLLWPSGVLYAASGSGGHELRLRSDEGEDAPWQRLLGQATALARCGPNALAVVVLGSTDPCVARFDGRGPALDLLRHGAECQVLVHVTRTGVRTLCDPRDLSGRVDLTGELDSAGDFVAVVGMQVDRPDGGRRFGIVLVDVESGSLRSYVDDELDLTGPVLSPDRRRVACVGTTRTGADGPVRQCLAIVELDGAEPVCAMRVDGWLRPRQWLDADHLAVLEEEHGIRSLRQFEPASGTWSDPWSDSAQGPCSAGSVLDALVAAGNLVSIRSAPDLSPVLCDGGREVLGRSLALAGTTTYRRSAPRGTADTGAAWVCRPNARRRGLVVAFHGGPLKSWADWVWRWNPWPFVEAGFAVALMEPPMSVGYPPENTALGWRAWRTTLADVAAAQVEEVAAECGFGDEPLALMGGSFGGYLALATAQRLHPRLVVAHAPPTDLALVALSADASWQWIREYGDPMENAELYARESVSAQDVPRDARVLLSHGLQDDLVPVSQSLALHRALLALGTRAELTLYRAAGHALLSPRLLRDWFSHVLICLDQELDDAGRSQ